MVNSSINSAKTAIEAHKIEQECFVRVQEDKQREDIRNNKNDEYNQKAIKVAEDCKKIAQISLVVSFLAMIIFLCLNKFHHN